MPSQNQQMKKGKKKNKGRGRKIENAVGGREQGEGVRCHLNRICRSEGIGYFKEVEAKERDARVGSLEMNDHLEEIY